MPYDAIPIGCNEHGPAAYFKDAKSLGKNSVDVRDVLRDLGADNDVERSIGLRDLRCIANRI